MRVTKARARLGFEHLNVRAVHQVVAVAFVSPSSVLQVVADRTIACQTTQMEVRHYLTVRA